MVCIYFYIFYSFFSLTITFVLWASIVRLCSFFFFSSSIRYRIANLFCSLSLSFSSKCIRRRSSYLLCSSYKALSWEIFFFSSSYCFCFLSYLTKCSAFFFASWSSCTISLFRYTFDLCSLFSYLLPLIVWISSFSVRISSVIILFFSSISLIFCFWLF